ncbi:hypothetical protein EMIT0196MI5_350021 [Pseudomonas sp. IT-196MI5]
MLCFTMACATSGDAPAMLSLEKPSVGGLFVSPFIIHFSAVQAKVFRPYWRILWRGKVVALVKN